MKKKKKKSNPILNGLTDRHVAQIVRRKMIQKKHGDNSKYNRKDKSWKNIDNLNNY